MIKAAILDLDGTLIDDNYLHALAWFRACRDAGLSFPAARLHRLVGMGADSLVPELLGHDLPGLSEAHDQHFELLASDAVPVDGAAELLSRLGALGLKRVVATSGKRSSAERLIQLIPGGAEGVDILVAGDDAQNSKPAPDLVAIALEQAGVEPLEAVMIGDTRWDLEAAGRCGVIGIAVMTGGWAREELRSWGAHYVFEDAKDLVSHLDQTPIGRRAGD